MRDSAKDNARSPLQIRVLLVDDHSLFLEGLQNLLATEGINVAGVANDGLEALAAARRLHPDIIFMDVQMPRCDGVTATRLIKSEMPEIKIVMLTMSDDEHDLFEAVKSGASGYLLKRLDAAEFFDYLTDLQAGHPPFSPGLAERILREFAHQSSRTEPTHAPSNMAASKDAAGPAKGGCKDEPQEIGLSCRQTQILTLVAQGHTYRQVGENIGVTERTVKYHMGEIMARLHLQNRAQVIAYAASMGLARDV